MKSMISYVVSLSCVFIIINSANEPFSYIITCDSIQWPSPSVRNVLASSRRYLPRSIIPTRFQTRGLQAVIAFPRLRNGVPVTLGKVSLLANMRIPDIAPFPSWAMQEEGSPDAIQNAVDLYCDENGILWVLDSGVVNTLETPLKKSGPKVLGFNFITGKLIHKVDLTPFSTDYSNFQYVVAENTLGRPFLFVCCSQTCSIFVWDVKNQKGGVVSLPNLSARGDVLYMVLLRSTPSEPVLVFSNLSSPTLFGLKVQPLREGLLGSVMNLGKKNGEMIILGTDNGSKLYFRWRGENRIRSWELGMEGASDEIVGNFDGCRTSTQVAGGSRLLTWSLESNFQDYISGQLGCVGASAYLRPLKK